MYAILLAGGHGTRLWPVSRKGVPKQLKPILGGDTLLKSTWKRLRKGLPASRVLVVTNEAHAALIRKDLPDLPSDNLLVEPMRRDTAAAIGFGAAVARVRDPKAVIAVINSDAFVKDEKEYRRVLKLASGVAARRKRIVLVGIRPTYPETGYGYIRMDSQAAKIGKDEIFNVDGFREKPDLETAKAYVSQWEYLWNPTLIVADAAVLLDAYRRHLPKTWAALARIGRYWKTPKRDEVVRASFERMKPVSVDYGILEKTKGMLVIPAEFGWADVGHWRAVHDVLAGRRTANVTRGPVVQVDSSGNLLYSFSGKLIAAAGLTDTIVVETEDAVLVCPKSRAQDVKKIVERLERKDTRKYL